ncbi:MAG: AMP-binding protein [Candidatus Heimdallarchaeota archaeon]|nr:MAG: AMP-binding protein [Candidatus Heimdallarchaeota archaeon]
MSRDRFWTKSYDEGVKDINPQEWETTFVQATRETFEKFPNALALEYMGIEMTFGELDRYSNQFAHMLIQQGFKTGDIIGINLPNTPQFIIALLGVLKAGCVVTGLSFLLSEDQLLYQLKDSGAKGIVTLDAIFERRLVNIAPNLPELKLYITTNVGDFLPKIKQILGKLLRKIPTGEVKPISGKAVIDFMDVMNSQLYLTTLPDIMLSPIDLAFVLYTGGTTGPPRGAMLSHQNVVANILMIRYWLNWEPASGIALSGFPFFHIAGMFFCENCIFLGWPQLLVVNPRDTDHICKLMKKYQPTCLVNVPSLYQMLLKNPKFKQLDHSRLDTCISSASPFPVESQKELESIVGEGKLLEVYGMTETSPLTTMNPYRRVKKLGTIGLPLMNTDIKLVDPATGNSVEIGEAGEICVKGPQVMKGYWKNPEETTKVIDEDGYIHTGDVAIMDEEGYLRIVDRTKDMIIVGGFKVFSSKLEDTLTQHPAINMVATIGVPHSERPGSELVKAFISLAPDYVYDGNEEGLKEEIIDWVKEKVAPYEVPKIVEIRDELPLTLVGKVDKKLLRNENQ